MPTLSTLTPETNAEFRRLLMQAVTALDAAAVLFGTSLDPYVCADALADRNYWRARIESLLE